MKAINKKNLKKFYKTNGQFEINGRYKIGESEGGFGCYDEKLFPGFMLTCKKGIREGHEYTFSHEGKNIPLEQLI